VKLGCDRYNSSGGEIIHREKGHAISIAYLIVLLICISFAIMAFVLDEPAQIIPNYLKINVSRSVLVTDYIALAGIGAALLNSAISGFFYLLLLFMTKTECTGKIFAALFVTIGFSFFGKNMFNTLPILFGVIVYSRVKKIKLSDLFATAMYSGTIAPIVSEIAFLNGSPNPLKICASYAVGIFIGFMFPVVCESSKRMHAGYCLYNGAIAGGFISTFFVGLLRSFGINVLPESFWDTHYTAPLAAFLFVFGAALILYGVISDKPKTVLEKCKQFLGEKDIREKDYLIEYGNTGYINIGVMCTLYTGVVLLLNIPVNGPTMGAILTVTGFAAVGKNFKNSIPILLGSILAAQLNHLDPTAPANSLAILFSAGLAPICGDHGWPWGICVGFLHVSIAVFIGQLNGGTNLYNNGFAQSFVAIAVVPFIMLVKELFSKQSKVGDLE